jgi:hypothetical protein
VVREDIAGQPPVIYERVAAGADRGRPSRALVGAFYSAELDVTWTIASTGGHLRLERHRLSSAPLTRVFGDVYQAESFFVLEFIRNSAGTVTALDVSTERARHVRFVRRNGAAR